MVWEVVKYTDRKENINNISRKGASIVMKLLTCKVGVSEKCRVRRGTIPHQWVCNYNKLKQPKRHILPMITIMPTEKILLFNTNFRSTEMVRRFIKDVK